MGQILKGLAGEIKLGLKWWKSSLRKAPARPLAILAAKEAALRG